MLDDVLQSDLGAEMSPELRAAYEMVSADLARIRKPRDRAYHAAIQAEKDAPPGKKREARRLIEPLRHKSFVIGIAAGIVGQRLRHSDPEFKARMAEIPVYLR